MDRLANNCTYVNAIGTVGNVSQKFMEQTFSFGWA